MVSMEAGGINETSKDSSEFLAKEVTTSPKEFVDRFLQSELFSKGRHDDLSGRPELRGLEDFKKELKGRKVTASEEEVGKVFQGMSDAKLLLLHFAKYELMLKYDDNKFNTEVNGTFGRYRAVVKKIDSPRTKLDLDAMPDDFKGKTIEEMDSERQFRHYKVIHALVDGGYVSSEPMARAMARVMLISINEDTFERAQSDEELRFKRLAEAAKFGHSI